MLREGWKESKKEDKRELEETREKDEAREEKKISFFSIF